jgi:hypothetical protein
MGNIGSLTSDAYPRGWRPPFLQIWAKIERDKRALDIFLDCKNYFPY